MSATAWITIAGMLAAGLATAWLHERARRIAALQFAAMWERLYQDLRQHHTRQFDDFMAIARDVARVASDVEAKAKSKRGAG